MRTLNALRAPSLPVEDVQMRFLNGERTWENLNAPVVDTSWKVTLPKLSSGVVLNEASLPAGLTQDTLAALKYLAKRKGR